VAEILILYQYLPPPVLDLVEEVQALAGHLTREGLAAEVKGVYLPERAHTQTGAEAAELAGIVVLEATAV
jgi:hypothetical protein